MKTTWLKTIARTTLAILMLAMFAQISVSAQDIINEEYKQLEDASQQRANARKLIGTWDVHVTLRNCQNGTAIRTFASIGTFMSGGTFLDSTSGTPQALKTPGHGVWSHISGRTYRFKVKSFSFDPSGNLTAGQLLATKQL